MSLPLPDPVPIREPAELWLDAVSRIDGCPACINTETPKSWAETARGYLLAYLCSDCGAAWTFEVKEQ